MAIEVLETLACRDWDPWRGQSLWLIARFSPCKNAPGPRKARRMADTVRAAFIERHGCEPLFIQNIERSAWWRAGPVEE